MSANLRTYGQAPFNVVLIHGGPGAPGYMAPVARELAPRWGILEPLQTKASLEGQLTELQETITAAGHPPFTLVGSSWGAMLGFLFAGRWPGLVAKLIMVGAGAFETRYAAGITRTRLDRLDPAARSEARKLIARLTDPTIPGKAEAFTRLGELFTPADACDPLTLDIEELDVQYDIYRRVWPEMEALRSRGQLVRLASRIRCPVVALHGDYDPHPAAGVQEPLASRLPDFRFILLPRCGHLPWIERAARAPFFDHLKAELPPVP